MKLIHEIFKDSAKKYGSHTALLDEYSGYHATYKQLYDDIITASAALQHLGLRQGMHIAQFSENSSKWMVLDQAVFNCGGVNAVRGSLAPINELQYIYEQSDSEALITDNLKVVEGLKETLINNNAKFIIYIGKEQINNSFSVPIISFDEILEIGKQQSFEPVEIKGDDVATLIYSSGTTGKPKGIMLTHANIASQITAIVPTLVLKETKTVTAVLPIWHAYERTCEYFLLSIGTKICYTNIKNFKKDLHKYNPHYLIAVPRLYEAFYEGIFNELKKKPLILKVLADFFFKISLRREFSKRIIENRCVNNQHPTFIQTIKHFIISAALTPLHNAGKIIVYKKLYGALGTRFVKGISGGGALAKHIDDFFMAIGLEILVGYGLTETAPILSVRVSEMNKTYSVGPALPHTEFIVADGETYKPLPAGQKGVVLTRGPQVMKGYYKDEENTKKVLLSNGYFVTGDIGWMTDDGWLVLTGRAKDIIVLSNGENIEPEAIEQSCMSSPFVKQIVIAGQDKSALSALVVPNMEAICALAEKKKLNVTNPLKSPDVKNEILKELRSRVQDRKTFRSHERLANIDFVEEEFSPENGLMTMTAKIKKNEVYEKYRQKIEAMYI